MKRLLALLFGAFLVASGTANAAAIISASILNNNQIVGPNDAVSFTARISNTGDETLAATWMTQIWNAPVNYSLFSLGNLSLGDINGILPGNFLDLNFVVVQPIPGGAPPGDYLTTYSMAAGIFPPGGGQGIVLASWNLEGRWTVAASVPEPASLALLGLGLAGLGAMRRRKQR